jgi:hypothetical protein
VRQPSGRRVAAWLIPAHGIARTDAAGGARPELLLDTASAHFVYSPAPNHGELACA